MIIILKSEDSFNDFSYRVGGNGQEKGTCYPHYSSFKAY
jgi:hypothetical protein